MAVRRADLGVLLCATATLGGRASLSQAGRTVIPKGISDLKGRAAIALVLGAILTLVLSASASAAQPFPKIK